MTTLPRGGAFTRLDLDSLPDDGRRHELVDGALVVTPAPSLRHQWVSSSLFSLLDRAAPAGFKVLAAPLDVVLDDSNVLQPDLLVVSVDDLNEDRPLRPLLVVEILSPSTRHIDLTLKRSRYEAARCPAYWVVDPDTPSLTAWELTTGRYEKSTQAEGEETAVLGIPFSVEITPARLLA